VRKEFGKIIMNLMLKPPEIRPLNREDYEQGKKIIRAYLPDQMEAYSTWYGKYGSYYLGCFLSTADGGAIPTEERLIGLAFGLPLGEMDPLQNEYFLLDGLAIKKEFRNLGYGSVLMDAWEERVFSSQPLTKISLGTEGERAVRFYRRRGYIPSGYLAFPDRSCFDKDRFESHRSFRRYREKKGMIFLYLNGENFDQNEKQELKEALNLSELVILMEKEA
jgi:ribosomal protein S18 acetylase RimI-like enzyme